MLMFSFDNDIKKLDREIAPRILKKLDWLSRHPEVLKFPLKDPPKDLKGLQRYRVWAIIVFFFGLIEINR